ncbi:universal stress protein [Natronorubrum sp. JWXQ-INN-674]|uniref:Universal stress protein n=1 Tax=Natronorubrum halalkaliphilum TaxID=2691917 RepID=A0A6B0VIQ9_9EURY|nr:universal stress protein [Natronorubrum halalkaliphilum]
MLVAVANPDHAMQLVRTAGDLARASDGVVQIVSVVVKSHESPFSVYSDETIIERYAGNSREILDGALAVAPDDVTVEDSLVVSRSVTDGILTAVEQTNARALVIGWEQRKRRSNAVLGTTIDQLIERAPCDLYVERIGHEANGVDSVLVPVAGGPHVRPAIGVAKAIAVRNDATVQLCSIVGDETDSTGARTSIERAQSILEDAPGPPVRSETVIRSGNDVTEELVEIAAEHDVVVFGATRQGAIHRRLVGSIPRTVTRRTDQTVILARDGEAVGGPILRQIRQLWPTSRG